ncbi:glutathione S-transferase family protein [Aspergillus saccharolyticus JOP 1030-1]|uniref:Putative glutathione S-transferase n=1 Tax=Aspergillus saccharolyticus JOP 1030-1 TaxID=1450539 RepID=A0A318Z4G7_9EURO|nr:putative glutathione S-transferase [Aspergillus saccharolyticus JOP 1030-1]PYH41929.1 putative glutathione S-transferase [Aspergillus saccharolyticus JOP 1030-1]
MSTSTPIHFFDIKSTLTGAARSWSPNTIKTRMVLNYKGLPYTQTFISYPDIAPLLSHMGVAPQPEGRPYTLPAICHPASLPKHPSGTLMDSFAIATHLEEAFPGTPSLFPSGDASYALALAVSKLMGAVWIHAVPLVVPRVADFLDPRGREYFIKTRSAQFGKPLSEVRPRDPQEIERAVAAMKRDMAVLVMMLRGRANKAGGPFFEGNTPGYADFLVVAVLAWFERIDKMVWEEMLGVGTGEVRALWEACLPWVDGQGEEKSEADWIIPH